MHRGDKSLSFSTVTRETRINLWFLAIFLVISLPGAVILFIKKLDPSAPRMDEPDAVLTRLPYMTPAPSLSKVRWMVPPVTYRWLTELTQKKTGGTMASALPPGPEWEPVISADHRVQVMSTSTRNGMTHLALAVWDSPSADDASRVKLAFQVSGHDVPIEIVQTDSVEIPGPVRHELVSLGYSHPPARIEWIDCDAKGTIEPGAQAVLTCTGAAPSAAQSQVTWTIR